MNLTPLYLKSRGANPLPVQMCRKQEVTNEPPGDDPEIILHHKQFDMTSHNFKDCISACLSCVTACQNCATECLKEDDIKMLSLCIAINRECALVCSANAQLLAIGGDNALMLCGECATICEVCAKECERNSELEYCSMCARECYKCAEECRNLMEVHLA